MALAWPLEMKSLKAMSYCAEGLRTVDILAERAVAHGSSAAAVEDRVAALEALLEPARRGEDCAIAALADSLQDWHAKVRHTALDALSEVATKGDRRVVYARLEAVQSLAPCAKSGKQKAMDAIRASLKDEHPSVRMAASEELAKIASENDSSDPGELTAKVFAVQALIACGDEASLEAICACLSDWHARVREAARKALKEILTQGQPTASKALEAFLCLALEGDERATSTICTVCAHETLARQALGSLVRVALVEGPSESPAAKAIAIKRLSQELLAEPCRMSPRDQEAVTAVLVTCAKHWHADLRRPTLEALCKLAEVTQGKGPCGQQALGALMTSTEPTAMKCLQKLQKLC